MIELPITLRDDFAKRLTRTKSRITERQALSAQSPNPELAATRFYNDFKDNLMAAGYARALKVPDLEIKSFLSAGGRAGLSVFQWHSTTINKVTYLPSFESEIFIDNSAINPITFVDTSYALLASKELSLLPDLRVAVEESGLFHDAQKVQSVSMTYAQNLFDYLMFITQSFNSNSSLRKPERQDFQISDIRYWLLQNNALKAIASDDLEVFNQTIDELSIELMRVYDTQEDKKNPYRFLQLPLLGLRALFEETNYH
jgi:hypothetical protein